MGKTAVIFPGQGSQYPGMGKDFYEQYGEARSIYEIAAAATGLDVKTICFTENDKLNQTEFTQIAMLATEIAMYKTVQSLGLKGDLFAGLSLGEYAALAAAGVMASEDCFKVIRKRGILMQNAYPVGGGMAAIIGLSGEKVEAVLTDQESDDRTDNEKQSAPIQSRFGIVTIANYNCPGQIVISGELNALDAASKALSDAGAKRCIPLKVSGPFHSALLKEAGMGLAKELENIELKNPEIPYITNVDASYVKEKTHIKDLLTRQIYSSVRWQQSMERMIADGVDTFIEIGPGKTLKGFMKKIDASVTCYSIGTVDEMNNVLEELNS